LNAPPRKSNQIKLRNMKKANPYLVAIVLFVFLNAAGFCFAQGTAFTYQGLLSESNGPANGSYDLTFKLFNASSGGTQAGSTITDTAASVSNGLFTVILDFGAHFDGTTYWLELGVRSNGVGSFSTLTPRQELTPTPYAVTAENLDGTLLASQLTGTLPSGLLSGSYGDALTLNNAGNSFSGNGSGLTDINALTLNGLGANNFWQTTGNAGTTPGVNFLGTTDGQALELSAPFVGLNRTNAIVFEDVFDITSPALTSYGGMCMDTAGSAGLPYYGYSQASTIKAYTFLDGSDFNKWELYNNGVWLTVGTNGMTGIGTSDPLAPLDLESGNHWDVFNAGTAGDFRIGDGTQGLKVGVATGGGGAGDTRVFAFGGTSRLILGTSTNDGVLTLSGRSVGIDTLVPASSAALDVEGATNQSDAVYGTTLDSGGNGVHGTASIGGNAYGVWGESYSGYGVVGNGYSGTGVGVAGYSAVSGSGTGVLASGADTASPALTIGTGGLQVKGAGVGTSTTAFIQASSVGNIFLDETTISNPLCDGDPNAVLIVTPSFNPPGVTGGINDHTIGVYYDGSHWNIFNEDGANMPVGIGFNVLVIKP
jgi:hypothetical protein